MVVYVEYIFLNNLAVGYIICYLTLCVFREPPRISRALFSSAIGAAVAVIYPALGGYAFAVKLLLSLVMTLILKKSYLNLKEYLSYLSVFYLITFAFGGASLAVSELTGLDGNLIPFAVAIGILATFFALRFIVSTLYEKRTEKVYRYDVDILDDGRAVRCLGYYDSGNKLFDKDNRPVIVISGRLAKSLDLPYDGEIAVNTVAGVRILNLVKLQIKIYYDKGANKIYNAHAAVSESFDSRGYDLILHRDMGGFR